MSKSRLVNLIEQMQDEAASEAEEQLKFHGDLRADIEEFRQTLAEKAADDDARYGKMVAEIDEAKAKLDDLRARVTAARKSSLEFTSKAADWAEGKAVELRRRMDADAGERQPPAPAGNARPLGTATAVTGTLDRAKLRPVGAVNGSGEVEPAAAVN